MPLLESVQDQQEELAKGNGAPCWEEDRQGVRGETETGQGAEAGQNGG